MPYQLSGRRVLGAGLLIAAGLLAAAAVMWTLSARGADHRDGPAAEGNAPLDITDVYAFRSPANNDNLVVAFGVNGLTTPDKNASARFSADATYTLHVSNDDDLEDEATVNIDFDNGTPQRFSITGLGSSPLTGEVTGPGEAPKIAEAGGVKAFAGLRDDPFFFDLVAFKKFVAGPYVPAQGLRAAADGAPADTFAGTNVSYIVLELPITAVTGAANSNTGKIQAWVSTSTGSGQLDRMAIPAINTALIPANQKDAFNRGNPSSDASNFRATAQTTMQGLRDAVDAVLTPAVGPQDGGPLGNLTSEQVAAALIPDIVTIDFSKDVVFPNGRRLTDDVIDTALQLVLNRTRGVTDAINGNDKQFGNSFPYLADPFLAASPTPAGQTPGRFPSTGGQPGGSDGFGATAAAALAAGGVLVLLAAGAFALGKRVTS
jgi:hypothetical protein